MIYFCCDPFRRNQLVGTAFNGIDYVEVLDHEIELSDPANRQKRLVVHFINDLATNTLSKTNIQIEGGERIQNIAAFDATVDGADAKALNVLLDKYGDFSIYTFRLVQNAQNPEPPAEDRSVVRRSGFFLQSRLSYGVRLPAALRLPAGAAPRAGDRLSRQGLRELSPADARPHVGFDAASGRSAIQPIWASALVELLAYAGDHLSYQQDAVATEAYLGTARRRVSVRRHARLVDYAMHDGCNARAWVQVQVNADVSSMAAGTQLFTRIPGQAPVLPDDPILRAPGP